MPSTTTYNFGDVVLVPFPFTNQAASKRRPAVVVSSKSYNEQRRDVILMALTSQVLRPAGTIGEVLLTDWKGAGLPKPSLVKAVVARSNNHSSCANSDRCRTPTFDHFVSQSSRSSASTQRDHRQPRSRVAKLAVGIAVGALKNTPEPGRRRGMAFGLLNENQRRIPASSLPVA